MTSFIPRQVGDDVTRAIVASTEYDNATVVNYLHNLWSVRQERQAFLAALPKPFLQALVTLVSGAGGVAAFASEVAALPTRSVARYVHLLTRDPGRDVTLATLAQSEVVADGYLPQALKLGAVTIDEQGRTAVSNAVDIQFGPVTSGSVETVVSVTHVALVLKATDDKSRVLSVIELAEPFGLRVGESVSIKAAALKCGVM
ncbi:hypothetical protein [Streptomyces sp. H27-C3]|uniref:phage tail fiber protein n=1 Tax=Streptomyces sp. H27-C3 TaxID=3046305 RepID=UPI0024B9601C|nr:hypothetical protein [Streptomyces sp. H27-C3]MDJ0463133.1 hypothetical protein [Streptomyces sp. H27-C3]